MFKNPFSFDGRIRRLEYGFSHLIYFSAYCVVILIMALFQTIGFVENTKGFGVNLILLFLLIPVWWFLLAQGGKRCHDLGRSAWFQLIPFYIFVMLFIEGDTGSNKYGPDPKGVDIYSEDPFRHFTTKEITDSESTKAEGISEAEENTNTKLHN